VEEDGVVALSADANAVSVSHLDPIRKVDHPLEGRLVLEELPGDERPDEGVQIAHRGDDARIAPHHRSVDA